MELLVMIIGNIIFFVFGYFLGKKDKKKTTVNVDKDKQKKDKERAEKINEAFHELMEYDYSKALGGGPRE